MKVSIVEDEINAYECLRDTLVRLVPSIDISEQLESIKATLNFLTNSPPVDLIFMDIQLSDGMSFEIFKHIEVTTPIIFTTAYDQYAIDAFKVNSVDYLLKPIHEDDLDQSLRKYYAFFENKDKNPTNANLKRLIDGIHPAKKSRCLVKKGSYFEYINIDQISLINSEESITFLHTRNGKRHLYSKTVENLVMELDPNQFFQINRSQIVNIRDIKEIHPYFNQRLKLNLTIPLGAQIELIVSRNKMKTFKNWVDS